MKTAMQELIEKLHARCNFCLEKELISEWGTLRMTIIEAQSLLEKEKEQIVQAFKTGYNVTEYDADEYFDLIYNQNK